MYVYLSTYIHIGAQRGERSGTDLTLLYACDGVCVLMHKYIHMYVCMYICLHIDPDVSARMKTHVSVCVCM